MSKSIRSLVHLMLALTAFAGVAAAKPLEEAQSLAFPDFFEKGPELKPSARLLELSGHRVRLSGFMARVERPQLGIFYLCPRPTTLDEEGAGTADLPPESLRVSVPALSQSLVLFRPGPITVVGRLDVGYHVDDQGEVSWVRLTAENPLSSKEN